MTQTSPTASIADARLFDFRPGADGPIVFFLAQERFSWEMIGWCVEQLSSRADLHPYVLAAGAAAESLGVEASRTRGIRHADVRFGEQRPAAFVTAGSHELHRLEIAARETYPDVPMLALHGGRPEAREDLVTALRVRNLPPIDEFCAVDHPDLMHVIERIVSEGILRAGARLAP